MLVVLLVLVVWELFWPHTVVTHVLRNEVRCAFIPTLNNSIITTCSKITSYTMHVYTGESFETSFNQCNASIFWPSNLFPILIYPPRVTLSSLMLFTPMVLMVNKVINKIILKYMFAYSPAIAVF